MTAPPLTGAGTPESVWRLAGIPHRLPVVDVASLVPPSCHVVVLAPHPDDELLGCGGTLLRLQDAGCRVEVVAITDGEASHAGRAAELRDRRRGERARALELLGLRADAAELHEPDGAVDEDRVVAALRGVVRTDDLLLAPWAGDGHPDHDAVGRAARRLHDGTVGYLVWAWHWATPADLPRPLGRVPLGSAAAAKRRAVTAHVSQLAGPDPILPPHVLERLMRDDEVLVR